MYRGAVRGRTDGKGSKRQTAQQGKSRLGKRRAGWRSEGQLKFGEGKKLPFPWELECSMSWVSLGSEHTGFTVMLEKAVIPSFYSSLSQVHFLI